MQCKLTIVQIPKYGQCVINNAVRLCIKPLVLILLLFYLGGFSGSTQLDTTEIYDASRDTISDGDKLPRKSSEHCIVKVS